MLASAALVAYAATAGLATLDNNDVWIHLTTGGLILDEGAVPRTDRYSFTATGNRYVVHEWLAAALYATAERAAGTPGVVVVAKLLPTIAIAAMLLAAVAATRAPWGLALPVLVLALTVLRNRVLARPELLALPILLAMLALLWRDREAARAGRRTRAVYGLVPLEALWANLHGSFPLGIALVLVFAIADVVERTLAPRDRRAQLARAVGVAGGLAVAAWLATVEPLAFGHAAAAAVVAVVALFTVDGFRPLFDDAPAARRGAVRWVGIAAAMAGVVVLNPLGAGIYAFPFEFTATQNVITRTVNEWKPLFGTRHLDGSLILMGYWAYVALACAVLAIAAWRRRLGRLELGLLLAFGVLPLRHVRWIGLSALVTAPALVALLDAARVSGRSSDAVSRATGLVLAGCGLACAGMAAAGAAGAWFDPWLLGALLVAVAAPGVALLLAARPRLSLRWGTAIAGLAALSLMTLASVHGIPSKAGATSRRWSGDGAGPGHGPSRQAVAATHFLRDAEVGGRLLTEYEWAGYAIHRLWPRVTVFIDSRSEVYGEAFLAEFRRVKNLGSAARQALDRHDVEIVLMHQSPYPSGSTRNRSLLAVIEDDPRWGLLFVDDRSVLYARRDLPGELPAFLDGFAPHRFRPDAPTLADPEFEAAVRRAVARAPRSAFLRFALASALRAQGRRREALAELGVGWAANPDYAAVAQLAGEIAVADGERERARRWFERAVEAAPNWPRARVALGSLSRPAE